MSELQDVSVKVPADRLADFYQWFGRWLAASDPVMAGDPVIVAWDPKQDLHLAADAWNRFPDRAQSVLSTLIDNPDRRFWGEQLAELHEIPHGRAGLAGSLAWPGRILRGMGRPLPIESEPDSRGGSTYWMTPALARLFGQARATNTS
jgi:Family of unknown function (DUF6416)